MAVFGVEFDKDKKVREFLEESNQRFQVENFLRNPFPGAKAVIVSEDDEKIKTAFQMEAIYPNTFMFGVVAGIAVALLTGGGFTWWYLLPAFFFFGGLLNSRYFFFFGLWIGLKKTKDYAGKARLMNDKKLLEELMQVWGRQKL